MKELGTTTPSQKALLDTGMLTENEKKRVYDRFRHRIMFPIADHRGRTVGFGGRVLGDGEPKYLNSPETPIFHKGSELYGLFAARGAIKEADSVLVVEGYMDVVALAEAGINHAVATLGTATTPMHLQRLFRHTKNIVFSFDGDRAGKAAGWKALNVALPLMDDGNQISFLFLPDGEDPDTMVKKVGRDEFLALIQAATPLPDFLLDSLQTQADINRLDGRAKLVKLAQPMLSAFPNGVLKKMVAERVAQLAQISVADLLDGKTRSTNSGAQPPTRRVQRDPGIKMTTVRRAISLLLQYPEYYQEYASLAAIAPEQIRGIDLVHQLFELCANNPETSTAGLLERFREQSYFQTLLQLAQHQHNNMEDMSPDEALALIQSNNKKILDEHNDAEVQRVTQELEALTAKSKITQLSESEAQRKSSLADLLRSKLAAS